MNLQGHSYFENDLFWPDTTSGSLGSSSPSSQMGMIIFVAYFKLGGSMKA